MKGHFFIYGSLCLSALLLCVILTGCSSPPQLSQPSGKWVDANQPAKK